MKRLMIVLLLGFAASAMTVSAQEDGVANPQGSPPASGIGAGFKYLGAALAVGIACIGGGMAVGRIGASAMGAMSENPELSGKALPFIGLAEGICLWGFLVGLLILVL